MNENQDFKLLDEAAMQLAEISTPPGPTAELGRQTTAAMRSAMRRHTIVLRSFISAAAAIALIALSLALWPFFHSAPLAFADVLREVEKTKTMTAVADSYLEPGKVETSKIFVKGSRIRNEEVAPGEWIRIDDSATGEELMLNPSQHRASHQKLSKSIIPDFYADFRDLMRSASTPLGDKVIDGKRLTGFGGTIQNPLPGGGSVAIPSELWVDPDTKLPVLINLKDPDSHKVILAYHDIHFDVPVDDALLDMTPPKGYQMEDLGGLTTEQLKPAATTREAESLTLKPGVGIGNLKFGATRDEIIALLGPPEDEPQESMGYPSRGLQIVVGSEEGMEFVSATAARGVGWNSRDFPGKTDKGIGMESTEKEVEAAYGPPDKPFDARTGAMKYDRLGMIFSLDSNGVVRGIWIQALPLAKPPVTRASR